MFFINPLNLLFEIEFIPYVFCAFGFYGIFLLLKKIFGRGV